MRGTFSIPSFWAGISEILIRKSNRFLEFLSLFFYPSILNLLSIAKRQEVHLFFVKVKVKLSLYFNGTPHHEGVLGSGDISPHIFDLGTTWS
jgi:hypothetical protein